VTAEAAEVCLNLEPRFVSLWLTRYRWRDYAEDAECSSRPFMRLALSLAYSWEGTGAIDPARASDFVYDEGWATAFEKAFGRRYWDWRNKYGRAGEYVFLGSQQSVQNRAHGSLIEERSWFLQAFSVNVVRVLDGRYASGWILDEPFDWGNADGANWVYPTLLEKLDDHLYKYEEHGYRDDDPDIGEAKWNIWWIRFRSFVMSPEQQTYWCPPGGSCIH
jgi:hypothetical protein